MTMSGYSVYVGNVSSRPRDRDLEDEFSRFGEVSRVKSDSRLRTRNERRMFFAVF